MSQSIEITVNGEPRTLQETLTLAELVAMHNLTPQRVAIEVNELLVRRAAFDQTTVQAGDRIEIVTLVGGG